MRVVQTYVVRLLTDTENAQPLRGTLRCVTDEREYAFGDQEALLRLLHELIQRTWGTLPADGMSRSRSAPHD